MPPEPLPVYVSSAPLEVHDTISPSEAARLVGVSRTDIYRLIRVLERYVDPTTGEMRPLPTAYEALSTQRERNAWRRRHLIVIPEWGAESVGHSDWRLSRMRLSAWLLEHRASIASLLAATHS